MATVILDPLGRLIRFRRIPVEAPPADGALTVNWAALFGEAGLDEREFVPEKPEQAPAGAARQAIRLDENDGGIRAASCHRCHARWTRRGVRHHGGSGAPPPARDSMSSGRSPAAEVVYGRCLCRSSRAPACWLDTTCDSVAAIEREQGGWHRRGLPEPSFRDAPALTMCRSRSTELKWLLFDDGPGTALGRVRVADVHSLEPHLRRVWPRTMISWTRLLSGQVRDPLVGRDVLIGMSWGTRSWPPRRSLSTERPRRSIRHSHKGAGEPVLYSPLREHRFRVSVGPPCSSSRLAVHSCFSWLG